MSNSDQQDGVDKDSDSNYVLEIDEATSTEFMTNSTANIGAIRLVKNDDGKDLSETQTSSWIRTCDSLKRFTVLERSLFLVTCGFAVFMIVMLVITKYDDPNNGCKVCTSPACVSASARIMSIMDSTVDPCQDFYQYACGRWIQNNPIPAGYSSWSTLQQLSQEILVVLKNIFEQPSETFPSEAEKRAHDFYQSCVNVNSQEELDRQNLLELLVQIGDWPAGNISATWNFQQVLETSHNVLISGGFFKWSLVNFKLDLEENNTIATIQLFPSASSLALEESEREDESTAYNQLVLDSTKITRLIEKEMALSNVSVTNITQIVEDIIEVDSQITQMVLVSSKDSLGFLTIDDFQYATPFLNWTAYFQSAFSQVNISFTPSSHRILYPIEFLSELNKFISMTLSKSEGPRKLQNYLGWQVVLSYLPYVSREFRDVNSLLLRTQGCGNTKEMWRCCVDETNKAMSFAVAAMYARQEFDVESKSLASSMVIIVKEAFLRNFDRLGWMDDETQLAAGDKADAMTDKIGYPTFILNRTRLDDFYNGLEINSEDYFQNKVRSNQFSARQHWMKLDKPFDKTFWSHVKPTNVNAYYSPLINQMILPVGGLKYPLFDSLLPHSLIFGAMGFFIGHELTHGFDDTGRQFDRNGYFRQWWNNATIERFNQQTECLIDQYSSYHYKGQHLDGKQTLGENIADNGGLKAAFGAFNMLVKSRDEDRLMLPGLNLTHNQLFFLSFAQAFCSSSTEDYLLKQILTDVHSPNRFRIIGTLSNMVKFSTEFQCPSGSPMNRSNKCQVW